MEQKVKMAREIFEILNADFATIEDMQNAIRVLVDVVKQVKADVAAAVAANKGEMSQEVKAAITKLEAAQQKFESAQIMLRVSVNERLSNEMQSLSREIENVRALIPVVPDVQSMIDGIHIPSVVELEQNLPQLGERIRDGLELLPEGERLSIDAVEGLRDELERLDKKKSGSGGNMMVAGPASGGRIVKYHDLSSSLDGSTKTFSLPAFWRVISVHFSSAPWIARPTTDYTTDASVMTITFTDQIDASTVLSQPQSVIIVYAES